MVEIEPLALVSDGWLGGLGGLGGLGVLAGLGALWLLAALVAARALGRRVRASRRARVDELIRSLCELNAQVAADRLLATLLVAFTEAPETLDRVDRVRARAWFDAARRLHRLLDAALAEAPSRELCRSTWAPSMGEAAASRRPPSGKPAPAFAESGACSNVTLIDPEFQAWIEAMRDTRGTDAPVSSHASGSA